MIIRELQQDDFSNLVPLLDQLGYPTNADAVKQRFTSLTKHPDYHSLVVVDNERLVGFAGLHSGLFFEADGQYIRVVAFVIDADYRRSGVGKMLMTNIEDFAKDKGITTIVLTSGNHEERMPAHHFYQQLGFKAKGTAFTKSI